MAGLRLVGVLENPLEKWELKHSEVYQYLSLEAKFT